LAIPRHTTPDKAESCVSKQTRSAVVEEIKEDRDEAKTGTGIYSWDEFQVNSENCTAML